MLAGVGVMLFFMVSPSDIATAAPLCEEENVETWFASRADCWAAGNDLITVFSTRDLTHAEHLATVATDTLETIEGLLGPTQEPVRGLRLIAWPSSESSTQSAEPQRLDGESLFLAAGADGNHIRSAISDIVVDRTAFPNRDQVPLWLRIGLRHWVRGGEQSALLRPARKIATDPGYAYDQYFSLQSLKTWPTIEVFQQIYISQSLAMLAWLLQDWPSDSLSTLFAVMSEGQPFKTALAEVYELDIATFVVEFTQQADRITQLSWPYTESPPWTKWFTTARMIFIVVAVLALFLGWRVRWWLRRPADVPRRRAGIELRRYLPRSGSFRF